jgi:hypothetical protein
MRILKLLLRFFLVLLLIFVFAATVYVRIYGKSLVERELNAALKRNVVLGQASYHFPLGFRAYNVEISRSMEGGEFLRVKKVIAQLSPDAIFQGKFLFDIVFLIEPSLVLQGTSPAPEDATQGKEAVSGQVSPLMAALSPAENKSSLSSDSKGPEIPAEIVIRKMIVRHGTLQYKEGLTEKGFSFDLEDVQLKAEHLVFPIKEGRSDFEATGRLIKEGSPISGSRVIGSGWVDVVKKDMEAKIEVIEANGTVGMTANAVARNNEMNVTGKVSTKNLLGGIEKAASAEPSAVNDLVLNALSSSGIEINAQFAFQTQMDHFRIGQISFSGSVVTSSDTGK